MLLRWYRFVWAAGARGIRRDQLPLVLQQGPVVNIACPLTVLRALVEVIGQMEGMRPPSTRMMLPVM